VARLLQDYIAIYFAQEWDCSIRPNFKKCFFQNTAQVYKRTVSAPNGSYTRRTLQIYGAGRNFSKNHVTYVRVLALKHLAVPIITIE